MPKEPLNDAMITGRQTYATLDDAIGSLVLNQRRHKMAWWYFFAFGVMGTGMLGIART